MSSTDAILAGATPGGGKVILGVSGRDAEKLVQAGLAKWKRSQLVLRRAGQKRMAEIDLARAGGQLRTVAGGGIQAARR